VQDSDYLCKLPFMCKARSTEETLFGWIVSDFNLNDAIESGLVKTPRVVIRDDGKLSSDYKSRLYHIYRASGVSTDLNRKAKEAEPLPDLVVNGYDLLGKDWLETAKLWREAGFPTPPVMISVANRTETAARLYYTFTHGKIHVDELADGRRTLHIDSKVLEKAEVQDEVPDLGTSLEKSSEEENGAADGKLLSKQDQAELLRRTVDTVGRIGEPGEQIQNVISVGMLTEGWDTLTVTHIMGLRAFSSQLLCEQVVGRGLRRTSYEIDPETGLFEPEYVNIFGVPFTFLPHEGGDGPPPRPIPPKTRIEPVPEKAKFEISWPNVLRIDHEYRPLLSLDYSKVFPLDLNAYETATLAEMAPVIDGKADVTRISEIDLLELARKFRMQRIAFEAARDVYDNMKPTWKGNKEYLLAQLIALTERFIASDRIRITPVLFAEDDLRRRLVLTLNMSKLVQHLWEAIRFENASRLVPIFDTERPIRSTADVRTWYTSKPTGPTQKSHINQCVYDSTWEEKAAFELDRDPDVVAWAKNDHLGYEILYVYQGKVKKYIPDFLIRFASGKMMVLEIKGQDTPQNRTKRGFLDEWTKSINTHGGFGHWSWDVSFDPADIPDILRRASGSSS
jgi:type III restriction enzyme